MEESVKFASFDNYHFAQKSFHPRVCCSHSIKMHRNLFCSQSVDLCHSSKMCFILTLLVFSSVRLIYCEWIQITQQPHRSSEITNRSIVINSTDFDYSKYKDFFSIIGPEMDFSKNYDETPQHIPDNSPILIESNKNEFHVQSNGPHFRDQFRKDQSTTAFSNVLSPSGGSEHMHNTSNANLSPIKSENLQTESTIKVVQNKSTRNSAVRNQVANENEQQKLPAKQTKLILKRTEFKPLDFNGVIKFFGNMQKSFSMDATGITDKIKFLQGFKDDIQRNIG